MNELDRRLSRLPVHDRVLAEAQLARAEAIADAATAFAAWLRKLARIVATPVVARAGAYSEVRTRRWPHDGRKPETAEFPSIGLQH